MAYRNAKDVLPAALVREIQKYIDGDTIYIPSHETTKIKWGQRSGSRDRYLERNAQIKQLYNDHIPIDQIASQFYLTTDSVRKILKKESWE